MDIVAEKITHILGICGTIPRSKADLSFEEIYFQTATQVDDCRIQ